MGTSRKKRTELSENTQKALQGLLVRIGLPPLRERLLEQVLTKREAQQFEKANLSANAHPATVARAILTVVAKERKLSPERALLEVAHRLGLVGTGHCEGLRQAIGEPAERGPASPSSPGKKSWSTVLRWDRDQGTLWWRTRAIRRIRVCGSPSRLEQIVDAFQKKGWEQSIDFPFSQESRFFDVHQVVNDLNRGLDVIRFHVQARGQRITWAPKPK
jgi:hypothetical protein